MRLTDYLLSAQANLRRTKARTVLTVTAIVVGTLTLSLTTAFGQGLQAFVNSQVSAYGSSNVIDVGLPANEQSISKSGVPEYDPTHRSGANYTHYLNASDLSSVKAVAGVESAFPDYTNVGADYIQQGSSKKYVIGIQQAFPGNGITLTAGHFPTANEQHSVVLPFPYVDAFGAATADELLGKQVTVHTTGINGAGHTYTFTVTGVLPDTAHVPGVFVSYQDVTTMAQDEYGGNLPQYSSITVITKNGLQKTDRDAIKTKLTALGFAAHTYDDTIAQFQHVLTIVQLGLTGFASITLLAATIGIVNTLLMAVLERTQEIGLLKALGMRRRGIFGLFLLEAMSIGFWGGAVGVGIGIGLGTLANPILVKTVFAGFPGKQILAFPPLYMFGIIALGMLLGLVAGALPAWRASRLDPIEALRHE